MMDRLFLMAWLLPPCRIFTSPPKQIILDIKDDFNKILKLNPMNFFTSIANSLRKHWVEGLSILIGFLLVAVYLVFNPLKYLGNRPAEASVQDAQLKALRFEQSDEQKTAVIDVDEIVKMFRLWDEARFGFALPAEDEKESE